MGPQAPTQLSGEQVSSIVVPVVGPDAAADGQRSDAEGNTESKSTLDSARPVTASHYTEAFNEEEEEEEEEDEAEDGLLAGLESHVPYSGIHVVESSASMSVRSRKYLDAMSPVRRKKGLEALRKAKQDQHAFWQQMGSHIQEQVDGRRSIYARHHWWIIEPNCTFRKIWDIVQALFLFYVAAVVPVRVGFEIPVDGVPYIVDLCVDSYWYADLLLNFITAYEQEVRRGEDVFRRVVYSPQHIARNYARTWFVFDLLAQMPVDTILRAVDGTFECSLEDNGCPDQPNTRPSLFRLFKLLRLARLVKLLRLIRITRLFERYQDDFFRFLPMLAILKLFVGLLFIGHMVGSFFYFFSQPQWMSQTEIEMYAGDAPASSLRRDLLEVTITDQVAQQAYQENWIQKQRLDSPSATIVEKYVASMYWAFTTLATVGYGDISATTVAERIYAIFAQIIGGFVFSGLIGSITSVVANIDRSKATHREKLQTISAFIKDRNLPKDLRKAVLLYFRKQESHTWDAHEILQELPRNLRVNVLEHEYLELLTQVSLLSGGSREMYRALCARIMPHHHHDGSVVFNAGEPALDVLIVVSGEVHVTEREFNTVHCVLGPGALFGEGSLFGENSRAYSVRSTQQSTLLSIRGTDLDNLLQGFPEITEQIRSAYESRAAALKLHLDALKDTPEVRLTYISGDRRPLYRVHNTDSPTEKGRLAGLSSLERNRSLERARSNRDSAANRRMTQLAEQITRAWDADDEIPYAQDASLLRSVNRDLVRERVGRVHPMVWDSARTSASNAAASSKAGLDDLRGTVKVLEAALGEVLLQQREQREHLDRVTNELRGLLIEALTGDRDAGSASARPSSRGPGGTAANDVGAGYLLSEEEQSEAEAQRGGGDAPGARGSAQTPLRPARRAPSPWRSGGGGGAPLPFPNAEHLDRFGPPWGAGAGGAQDPGGGRWRAVSPQQLRLSVNPTALDASMGGNHHHVVVGGNRSVWYEDDRGGGGRRGSNGQQSTRGQALSRQQHHAGGGGTAGAGGGAAGGGGGAPAVAQLPHIRTSRDEPGRSRSENSNTPPTQ